MKKIYKFTRSYHFVVALFISSCAPSLVHALEVDVDTEALIVESVDIELSHNLSLKDPVDNLALNVFYSNMVVVGKSIQVLPDADSDLYTYQVIVPYSTLDGESGSIICSASFTEKNNVKKAKQG